MFGFGRSCRGLIAAFLVLAAAFSSKAATITDPVHFTDRFASHSLPTLPIGDFVQVGATVASSAPPVSVVAFQGGTLVALDQFSSTDPLFGNLYNKWISFDASLTGNWTILATDGGPMGGAITPSILEPEFLPFVFDIAVLGSGDMPLLQWSVPDLTGFDVDQTRIRAIEALTGLQIYQIALPGTPGDFVMPAGFLKFGTPYVFRISLEDVEFANPVVPLFPDHVENRSNAFSDAFTPAPVPEPGTLGLLAGALLATAAVRLRRAIG